MLILFFKVADIQRSKNAAYVATMQNEFKAKGIPGSLVWLPGVYLFVRLMPSQLVEPVQCVY